MILDRRRKAYIISIVIIRILIVRWFISMESLHYLLMKSHLMLSRKILAEAAKIGLTAGQPKVLDFLRVHEEADQKTIASYCEIEQATAGSILLRMEKAGLIVRRQHEGNRRSLFVSLTDKGKEAARQTELIFRQAEEPVEAVLTEEEQEMLKELLIKVNNAISDHTFPGGHKL